MHRLNLDFVVFSLTVNSANIGRSD